MKIQAIALNQQPDFLRLPLVNCLVAVLGGHDGAGLYSDEPCCREALAPPQNPPSLGLGSGFVPRLKQVLNRSEASTPRIMKLIKATCRVG